MKTWIIVFTALVFFFFIMHIIAEAVIGTSSWEQLELKFTGSSKWGAISGLCKFLSFLCACVDVVLLLVYLL